MPQDQISAWEEFKIFTKVTTQKYSSAGWGWGRGAGRCSLVTQWWKRVCSKYRRCELDPWVRNISWRRKWQPTPVFLPGESHGQRSLTGYSPWGCKELGATEQLTLSFTLHILDSFAPDPEETLFFSSWILLCSRFPCPATSETSNLMSSASPSHLHCPLTE